MNLADSLSHDDEDHRVYYCHQEHGYWSGTLIRIRTVNNNKRSNEDEEFYEMKIYNRYGHVVKNRRTPKCESFDFYVSFFICSDPIKISNLCKTFINELGRKVSIKPLTGYNRNTLELELKYRFREEANALNELSKHLKYKTDKVQKSYVDFIEAQHKTDSIWTELINDQIE